MANETKLKKLGYQMRFFMLCLTLSRLVSSNVP